MGLITLSDHLHDIAENSVNAGAKNVNVVVLENAETFFFSVEDDAGGIRTDMLEKIFDPFVTTRKKEIRRVGLGLPFLKQAAESTGGYVKVETKLGEGTKTEALFYKKNIDCQPVGDIAQTFLVLLLNEGIHWHIKRCFDFNCYEIDTDTIGKYVGKLDSPGKISLISEMLEELENSLIDKENE